ncbi:MAG: glycerol-3-phosphate acyltransferase [Candidatus Pacebacteria bacterium]|nr:glycerol-3-phosphate acyltransferase [Candidatus Paceibacterota bacterium]
MSDILIYILIAFFAYGLGSIPFAKIFSSKVLKIDLKQIGSKNLGALNTFRASSKKYGLYIGILSFLAVFFLDTTKAVIAAYIAKEIGPVPEISLAIATFFVVLGHNYSLFLNFKGGRGAASFIGILLFFNFKTFLGYLVILLTAMTIGEALAGRKINKKFLKHSVSDQVIGRLIGEVIGILWIGATCPVLTLSAIFATPLIIIAHQERIKDQLKKIKNKTYLND